MPTGFRRTARLWRWVLFFSLADMAATWLAFLCGIWIRFGEFSLDKWLEYGPGVLAASIVLPATLYIGGLYAEREPPGGLLAQFRWLFFGFLGVVISVFAVGAVDFSSRVGRGVLAGALPILVALVLLRHFLLLRRRKRRWRTVLCLVTGSEDEMGAALLSDLWGGKTKLLGVVTGPGYRPSGSLPVLGEISGILDHAKQAPADVLLVRDHHLGNPAVGPHLRRLRYEGVEIVSLVDVCEDAFQAVPLELVSDAWLFRASHGAGIFYVRRLKRLFDVLFASLFLILLSPFLLLGMLAVRIASPGPVFFRQARAGRLERSFTVIKLRTMRPGAEDGGARWSGDEDPRIFPAGKLLRRFRIDEIPQLFNILEGDMSFVGPRPEQAALIEELDRQIPFYRERLLIQPGLTGWAQVRYPYGATIEDAARKLEYDLYYMKHMSLFLDFCILLETIRIILFGGVARGGDLEYHRFRGAMEEAGRACVLSNVGEETAACRGLSGHSSENPKP